MRTILVTLLALSSAAYADDLTKIDRSTRWEGAFGIRVGSVHVGSFDGMGFGFHLDGGARFDRLFVYGEYSYLMLSNAPTTSDSAANGAAVMPPPEIDGVEHRIGANARYSVGKITGEEVPLRGDFWLEAGVGERLVQWDQGGELRRPDMSFGFGGQFGGRFGREHDHHAGIYYAMKMTFSRAPESYTDRAPTCAGPCDTPTRPNSMDRSFLFNLGIVFGN
jgi:hypothetical protein